MHYAPRYIHMLMDWRTWILKKVKIIDKKTNRGFWENELNLFDPMFWTLEGFYYT